MAFDVYDDYEQGERVRKWLVDNWISIVLGLGIGLGLVFGWQKWQSHKHGYLIQAATQYDLMNQALNKNDNTEAKVATDVLAREFADTVYAVMAKGSLAAQAARKGNYPTAEADLSWASAHASLPSLKALMQVRLARVQIAAGQAKQALFSLQKVGQDDYRAQVAELQGDAEAQLGNQGKARQAYKDALLLLPAGAANRNLLQMKLENLTFNGTKSR